MASVEILAPGRLEKSDDGNIIWTSVCLITADDGAWLFDVGEFHQRLAVRRRLAERGLRPEDIGRVVLSHLHWDHALNFEMFPRATFMVSQAEWQAAAAMPPRDIATPAFLLPALRTAARVVMVEDEAWPADVRPIPSPGHTAGHLAMAVQTESGRVVLAGDACPTQDSLTAAAPEPIFFDRDLAIASRDHLVSLADILVPGHGLPFRVSTGEPVGRRL